MDTNIDLFGDNVKNSNISPVKIFNNSKFGTLRVFVIDGEIWFIGNDVSTMLGYEVPKKAVYDHVKDRDKRLVKLSDVIDNVGDHEKGSRIYIINDKGFISLIQKSNIITSVRKKEILMELGIEDHILLWDRSEIRFKDKLLDFYNALGYDVHCQYAVGGYRVDFYIKKINLAIEYDENDHSHYDVEKEVERERYIKSNLKCDFIRLSDKSTDCYNLGVIAKYMIDKMIGIQDGIV